MPMFLSRFFFTRVIVFLTARLTSVCGANACFAFPTEHLDVQRVENRGLCCASGLHSIWLGKSLSIRK